MTSPDPKSTQNPPSEGGGMLPALLAGAGILLVAGLLIFGDDDEKKAIEGAKDGQAVNAAHSAKGRAQTVGGVAARPTDDATKLSRPQPRLNPRIANAIVTEGMAPSPNKKPEPTSFASTADEIAYWEEELRAAEGNLEIREQAAERAPKSEAKIREHGTAEDLAQFQKRLEIVNDNLEKAQARVAEVEAKLAELHGG
ncbi:MAG: hypothetical protein R6X02_13940 [Enhygromyxa sp.]